MNFLISLEATISKVFYFVYSNLIGPGISVVQRWNRNSRDQSFIIFDESNVKTRLIKYMYKLGNEKRVTVSLSSDGTTLTPYLTLSNVYGDILVGAEPNHFISVRDMSKE